MTSEEIKALGLLVGEPLSRAHHRCVCRRAIRRGGSCDRHGAGAGTMKLLLFTVTRINGEVPKVRYRGVKEAGSVAECFEMAAAERDVTPSQ